MKTKILSLALVLGLMTVLGACSSEGGGTGGTGTETSPSPGGSPAESPTGTTESPSGTMESPGESASPSASPS